MTLITRTSKGSKLTIQEMDGNLTYLETEAKKGQVTYEDISLLGDGWGGKPITKIWFFGLFTNGDMFADINTEIIDGFIYLWLNTLNGEDWIKAGQFDGLTWTMDVEFTKDEDTTYRLISNGVFNSADGMVTGTFSITGGMIVSGTFESYMINWIGEVDFNLYKTQHSPLGLYIDNGIAHGYLHIRTSARDSFICELRGTATDENINMLGTIDNYQFFTSGTFVDVNNANLNWELRTISPYEVVNSGTTSITRNADSTISQIVTLPNSEVYEFGLPLDTSFDNTAAVAATEGIRISASTTSNITFEVKTLPIVDLLLTVKIKN